MLHLYLHSLIPALVQELSSGDDEAEIAPPRSRLRFRSMGVQRGAFRPPEAHVEPSILGARVAKQFFWTRAQRRLPTPALHS